MILMTIFNPKRKKQIKDALKKGDATVFRKQGTQQAIEKTEEQATGAIPIPAEPAAPEEDSSLEHARIFNLRELEKEPDLSPEERTANDQLHTAVSERDLGGIKDALAKGADVNARSGNGGTALQYASTNGHKDTVELLISNGADVNAVDDFGETALMWASQAGHKEIVELLKQHGAKK